MTLDSTIQTYALVAGEMVQSGQYVRLHPDGFVWLLRDGDGLREGDVIAIHDAKAKYAVTVIKCEGSGCGVYVDVTTE